MIAVYDSRRGGREIGGHSGIKGQELANSGTAQGLQGLYSSNAAQMNPGGMLTAEAVSPSGYTPSQMGAQTTAAEQTAGGANAGATGGALRNAVRTRNVGAVPAAIADSNRGASENLSQTNAGIQTRNADLMQRQHQAGISGLEDLYKTNVGAGENALGLSNSSLNDAGNLKNFWQDLLMQGMKNGEAGAQAIAAGG